MEPVAKKKRKSITLNEKFKIIQDVENGRKVSELCEKYQLPRTTIRTIVGSKEKIKQIQNRSFDMKCKKYLTQISENPLERSLIAWVQEKRDIGEPLSGAILKQQALCFHNQLNSNDPNKKLQFKASNGWLDRFIKRNGLRTLKTTGENPSADFETSEDFVQAFSQFIEENDFELEDIYNAAEFGLEYKLLPSKTLILPTEKEVSGYKPMKERVTVMVCANASGNHRIPLLVIGKNQNPMCFQNVDQLPVRYEEQPKPWMNRTIFKLWYKDHFIPSVLQRKPNGRFLLLLDNAPMHAALEELNEIGEKFFVVYLPPNVTSLIQPMKNGVISEMKKYYYHLSGNNQSRAEVIQFYEDWLLLDCLKVLQRAWDTVSESTLANAWKHLLPSYVPNVLRNPLATKKTRNITNADIAELLNKIPEGAISSGEDMQKNIQAYKLLSDEELLNRYGNTQLLVPEQSFNEDVFEEEFNTNGTNENEDSAPSIKDLLGATSTLLKERNKIPNFSRAHLEILVDIRDQLMSLDDLEKCFPE